MKAIVLHEYGGPDKLKYEDVDDPVAGEGELLVRLAATSVNPIDYKMRSGAAREHFPVEFPGILGRDIAGIVRAVGPGVSGFAPGDKVIALGKRSYAELAVVKAQDATLAPEGLDLVEAAALPLVTLTGEQLVTRGTGIKSGQTILVSGALGGVGRSAVWTAKKAGATVIAGVRKGQLKEAQGIGADEVIALDDTSAMEELGFVDAVADTVGGKTAEMLLAKVKQGGVFGSVLGPPANAKMHPTVKVTPVMAVPDAAALRSMAEDVAAKRFSIPIDRMIPLEEAGEGQAAAEKGGIGKVLLLA
ncbi:MULTISPECIES: NADP-dependent oxidoreductase [Acidobacteriaceae]|uniref:NADP-dependent oxidoreductase n=1 Tax=Acidobacteriaceae TaxID=204434 RepID=UPI00131E1DEA|nr:MULTISPECIES: NADP-dependent oxidoreductase [Acidobacteriaceae]MDW5265633.1 NADP-dependent oxidoreductase [Edaphobacter sp.]